MKNFKATSISLSYTTGYWSVNYHSDLRYGHALLWLHFANAREL